MKSSRKQALIFKLALYFVGALVAMAIVNEVVLNWMPARVFVARAVGGSAMCTWEQTRRRAGRRATHLPPSARRQTGQLRVGG